MLSDFSNRYLHRRKVAMLTKHLKACPVWLVESFGSQDTCRHAHTSSCHIYLGQASLEHVVLSEVSLPVVISVSLQMIRHAYAGHFLSARGRAATVVPRLHYWRCLLIILKRRRRRKSAQRRSRSPRSRRPPRTCARKPKRDESNHRLAFIHYVHQAAHLPQFNTSNNHKASCLPCSKPTELPIISNKGGVNRREKKALRCSLPCELQANQTAVGRKLKANQPYQYSPTRSRLKLKSRRLRSTALCGFTP